MRLDSYGNPIYEESDIFNLIYNGLSDKLDNCILDNTQEISALKELAELTSVLVSDIDYSKDVESFDKARQSEWLIPEEYKTMDIEGYLLQVCPKENYQRLIDEINEFKSRNMIPLLRALKYLVDSFREHNVVWGVGRGSSVASYVLYLIGVHKIDSVKYNLDWREFLR